jgi:phosphoglycolate phosphatase-like HAD superfamily hydrolase
MQLRWELASDATDSGGAAAHFLHHAGRAPTKGELRTIQDRFLADLHAADVTARPVPGARDVLARVEAHTGWTTAIATGNWHAAAKVKFGWAGLPWPDVPIGSADDAHGRADILRAAIARAAETASVAAFDRVVYFGDGLHDVRATRELGIGFVAVVAVRDPAPLRAEGAAHFLDDFVDEALLLEALERAPIPGRPDGR